MNLFEDAFIHFEWFYLATCKEQATVKVQHDSSSETPSPLGGVHASQCGFAKTMKGGPSKVNFIISYLVDEVQFKYTTLWFWLKYLQSKFIRFNENHASGTYYTMVEIIK